MATKFLHDFNMSFFSLKMTLQAQQPFLNSLCMFVFRVLNINIIYSNNGEIVDTINNTKLDNVSILLGSMKSTGIYLAWKDRQR